MFVCTAYID